MKKATKRSIITAATLATIYAWTQRKTILNWAFNHHTDQPETPDGWAPKMRTWINGVEQ